MALKDSHPAQPYITGLLTAHTSAPSTIQQATAAMSAIAHLSDDKPVYAARQNILSVRCSKPNHNNCPGTSQPSTKSSSDNSTIKYKLYLLQILFCWLHTDAACHISLTHCTTYNKQAVGLAVRPATSVTWQPGNG